MLLYNYQDLVFRLILHFVWAIKLAKVDGVGYNTWDNNRGALKVPAPTRQKEVKF